MAAASPPASSPPPSSQAAPSSLPISIDTDSNNNKISSAATPGKLHETSSKFDKWKMASSPKPDRVQPSNNSADRSSTSLAMAGSPLPFPAPKAKGAPGKSHMPFLLVLVCALSSLLKQATQKTKSVGHG
jgi:hypothetical protein